MGTIRGSKKITRRLGILDEQCDDLLSVVFEQLVGPCLKLLFLLMTRCIRL